MGGQSIALLSLSLFFPGALPENFAKTAWLSLYHSQTGQKGRRAFPDFFSFFRPMLAKQYLLGGPFRSPINSRARRQHSYLTSRDFDNPAGCCFIFSLSSAIYNSTSSDPGKYQKKILNKMPAKFALEHNRSVSVFFCFPSRSRSFLHTVNGILSN
jgi:hypothetical protein